MPSLPTVDLRELRLDQALTLLQQAGYPLPPCSHGPAVVHLQAIIDGLCDLSLRDALTGLANRRHFRAVLEREIDRVARTGESALLLVLDIDHFKHVNDTYGHAAGDKVLRIVAQALAKQLRSSDFIARYGGEEFVMILPGTAIDNGTTLANRMRELVARIGFHFSGKPLVITISCGITQLRAGDDPGSVFERADRALYRAKEGGRNCVVSA